MTEAEEEIEFCAAQLERERQALQLLEQGVRLKRGLDGGPLEDVSDRRRRMARTMIAYWEKRLASLGTTTVRRPEEA